LENIDVISDDPLNFYSNCLDVQIIDRSGVLWVSSMNGIYKHDILLSKFNLIRADRNYDNNRRINISWSMIKDSENVLWVGTSFGLVSIERFGQENSYNYTSYTNEDNLEGTSVNTVVEFDDNSLLILSCGKLFKFNKNTHQFSSIVLPWSNVVNRTLKPTKLCKGKIKGEFWLGTSTGVLKYNSKTKLFKEFPVYQGVDWVKNNRTNVVYVDSKDRIWLGSNNGLGVFFEEEEKFHIVKGLENESFGSVWTVYESKYGEVWFGSMGKGLFKIDKFKHLEKNTIYNYTTENGLSNNYVYGILPDSIGNLWLSTNYGVCNLEIETYKFSNYTLKEGLQGNEFNSGAFLKADDGELFFGGANGINRFFPSKIRKNEVAPNVIISELTVADESYFLTNHDTINEFKLRYDQAPIKFEFSAMSYNSSVKNQFMIQLENYDNDWLEVGNQTSFIYSKLQSGTYYFKVKGSNSDGFWSSNIATVKLIIAPPFWKTWWFYGVIFIAVSGLVYLVFRLRFNKLKFKSDKLRIEDQREHFKKQNQEKIFMMQEIHHRVKNNLQVVNSLLKMQSREIEDPKIVDMFKDSQSRVLALGLLHEKMYRSKDLKHVNVAEHFEVLIRELVDSYSLGISIELDLMIKDVDFGVDTLAPLSLIVNEVITNTLKHAFLGVVKGKITVTMSKIGYKTFRLIIGDNGVGLSEESKTKSKDSFGTELLAVFTEQLDGRLELLETEGTYYRLEFKNIDK
jgi:two-component sensor histidine kinase/streptogramin lyase